MKTFPQKRILITGAGSGLGRALSLEFASHGWKIAVADIDKTQANETVRLIKKTNGSGLFINCDVTQIDHLKRAAKIIKEEWGGLDILINNAGMAVGGPLEKVPLDQWEKILNLNLKGVILGCSVFIPLMKEQGFGHIVNTASAAGFASFPRMSSYNLTKAALISLSETLYFELSPHNIGASVIISSFFRSNILKKGYFTEEQIRERGEKLTASSRITAEDVAKYTYKSIKKNKLYIIPQFKIRLLCKLKTIFPNIYLKILRVCLNKN